MNIPTRQDYERAKEKLQKGDLSDSDLLEIGSAMSAFETDNPLMRHEDVTYLLHQDGLYDPDPDYRLSREYDVVYCKTCWKSDIEPEIKECEGCAYDVCPHCCGTVNGWHEICRRDCDGENHPILERLAFLLAWDQPVDMLLYCPQCGNQHIDAPNLALDPPWKNPPHKSHECQFCLDVDGKPFVWRPSDRYTNGVKKIKTKGKLDGDPRPKYMTANPERITE